MRVSARVAAVITALALVGVPASAAGSAFPGTNGRIAFSQSTGNGLTDSIFTVNPDGSGLKQLTSGHSDSFPRFSADAKSIVFTRFGFASSTGGTASHVMLIHSDGTGLIDLSTADVGTPFSDGDPSFSPDGTHIVFDRTDTSTDQSLGIFETTPTSSAAAVRLTTGQDAYPTFSPDGTHIAFARLVNDTTQAIFTAAPTPGAPAQQVTHPPTDSFDLLPDYSPDGKRIVFERDTSIYVANADGSGTATLLTSGSPPLDNANPAFSPDGTKIVFASTRATLNQSGPGGSQAEGLFTMSSTNGSNVTPVPGLAGNASFSNQAPDWGTGAAPSQQPPPPPPPPSGCGSTNEPEHNGDLHSNCHTGAKGRGAGGNDKAKKRR
jgi:Tol biopolymer transport system component